MDLFLLWHTHTDVDLPGGEDFTFIVIYASRELAEAARKRAEVLPGFSDHIYAFEITEKILNKDSWTNGFTTAC